VLSSIAASPPAKSCSSDASETNGKRACSWDTVDCESRMVPSRRRGIQFFCRGARVYSSRCAGAHHVFHLFADFDASLRSSAGCPSVAYQLQRGHIPSIIITQMFFVGSPSPRAQEKTTISGMIFSSSRQSRCRRLNTSTRGALSSPRRLKILPHQIAADVLQIHLVGAQHHRLDHFIERHPGLALYLTVK